MARTWAELQKTSDADLIREHDETARSTGVGLNYFRDEILRRETAAQNKIMLDYTREVRNMTRVITVLTILVTGLTGLSVWIAL